ncbi:MAG TPA: hypothetical protein VHL09_09250, partial [Dehalococcoidia bacterium]|nr:hypothetical protein [Dehalococcoidia bacterium]
RLDRAFPWLIGVVDAVPGDQSRVSEAGSGIWTPDPLGPGSTGAPERSGRRLRLARPAILRRGRR